MPEQHEDKRPFGERIAAEIRKLIMDGDLEPGAPLPSTERLCAQYGTTNVTIQRATRILKDEGLLVGRNGVGIFVREEGAQAITPAHSLAPSEPGQPYRWLTAATENQQRGKYRMLTVTEVKPPKQVRLALGLDEDGTAILRSRVGYLDDKPAELVHSYYPVELARGTRLEDPRLIPGGSPRLLDDLGFPTRSQDDVLGARPATTDEYLHLELPRDVPVIEVFRIVYSDDQKPIEVTLLAKPAHRFKMAYSIGCP
ncbi:GntR family transcriptional regulator [Streptomyces sp. SID8352]|uniref:GntR family transcriptional regulator n=1 Tax=Streptomyces sp. SID8352 TaxID=2690338 RepID=UPI00136977B2|nr:GntR family transcriptional regulator [Streptomyces sp. SID8352]MYU20790.1 UTRA domain-containing protein [Streptomyces sp. SID8352]